MPKTYDAIPVDWIKDRIDDKMHSPWTDFPFEEIKALVNLITDWYKQKGD